MEWIEIPRNAISGLPPSVSTLAVEWIEIIVIPLIRSATIVSTLAVEWIEMSSWTKNQEKDKCLHPRGGVD